MFPLNCSRKHGIEEYVTNFLLAFATFNRLRPRCIASIYLTRLSRDSPRSFDSSFPSRRDKFAINSRKRSKKTSVRVRRLDYAKRDVNSITVRHANVRVGRALRQRFARVFFSYFRRGFHRDGYSSGFIFSDIFPDDRYKRFSFIFLATGALGTFSLPVPVPSFIHTRCVATKMPGCSFAWKNGRISTAKTIPLISISKPYSTSLGFALSPFAAAASAFSIARRVESEEGPSWRNEGLGRALKYEKSFVLIR